MSYILEALKKAERERGLAQVPRVTTVHDLESTQRNNTLLVAGGLVVCAVAVLWFAVSIANMVNRPPPPATVDVEPGSAVAEIGPLVSPTAERSSSLSSGEIPPSPNDDIQGSVGAQISPEAPVGSRPDRLPPQQFETYRPEGAARIPANRDPGADLSLEREFVSAGSETESLSSAPAETAPQRTKSAPGGAAIENAAPAVSTQAKPQSLKEALSAMQVSLLMYAEAEKDRIVFINGRKYTEGDYVDERYLIENITPQGVVLSYNGERAVLHPH